jgi:hypothetical protein
MSLEFKINHTLKHFIVVLNGLSHKISDIVNVLVLLPMF